MKVNNDTKELFVVKLEKYIDMIIEDTHEGKAKKITITNNATFDSETLELTNSHFWKMATQLVRYCNTNDIIIVPNTLIDTYKGFNIWLVVAKVPYFLIEKDGEVGFLFDGERAFKAKDLAEAKNYINKLKDEE